MEIKGFNALINKKLFLQRNHKNKLEAYKKLEMYDEKRYDNYTTGNLLDHLYHQNHYKLTGIGLLLN